MRNELFFLIRDFEDAAPEYSQKWCCLGIASRYSAAWFNIAIIL